MNRVYFYVYTSHYMYICIYLITNQLDCYVLKLGIFLMHRFYGSEKGQQETFALLLLNSELSGVFNLLFLYLLHKIFYFIVRNIKYK